MIKISKIVNCRLDRVGDLQNDFYLGACGTYDFSGEQRVMLCFPFNAKNQCYR